MTSGYRLRDMMKKVAPMLSAVGHPTRASVVYLLAHYPMDIGELVDRTVTGEPLLIHHLNVLLKTGWVSKTKIGKTVTYRLTDTALKKLEYLVKGIPWFEKKKLNER